MKNKVIVLVRAEDLARALAEVEGRLRTSRTVDSAVLTVSDEPLFVFPDLITSHMVTSPVLDRQNTPKLPDELYSIIPIVRDRRAPQLSKREMRQRQMQHTRKR